MIFKLVLVIRLFSYLLTLWQNKLACFAFIVSDEERSYIILKLVLFAKNIFSISLTLLQNKQECSAITISDEERNFMTYALASIL
jgi:hypothetical protein